MCGVAACECVCGRLQTDVDGTTIELVILPRSGPPTVTIRTRYLPESSDTEAVKMSNSDSYSSLSRDGTASPATGLEAITASPALSFSDTHSENVSDLVTLMHLNEPCLLHVLHLRFAIDRIYTYSGRILLAVNPFRRVPLYTADILEQYVEAGVRMPGQMDAYARLPPHVYALTDFAYHRMSSDDLAAEGGSFNQSLLVSGESGAGKTESTKVVLRYLTEISRDRSAGGDASNPIADQVLKSNPILEAFGNARTTRNENSSRFGKFILLQFGRTFELCGAMIRT